MKIYFTAAITNVDISIRKSYPLIIETLEKMGHDVIVSGAIKNPGNLAGQTETEAITIQQRLSKWKKQADVVIVEASTPSFGVGQEIAEALSDNKQVVVMYVTGHKPHILVNQGQQALYFAEYIPEKIQSVLQDYIEYAKANSDTRFNFFISPQIGSYLDWVSRKKKLPRAVYLRRLIEEDMEKNKAYEKAED